jgi:hypothetical protein
MPNIHQTGGYHALVRKRHRLALSLDKREEISRGLVAQSSIRGIAENYHELPQLSAARSRDTEAQNNTVQHKQIRALVTVPRNQNLESSLER